jgi:hypothetical protein
LNQSSRHIIDPAVPRQRVECNKEPGLVVIQFIEAGTEIRFDRKQITGFSDRKRTAQDTQEDKNWIKPTRHRHTSRSSAAMWITKMGAS